MRFRRKVGSGGAASRNLSLAWPWLVALLILVASPPITAAQTVGSMRGVVTSESSGEPLVGAVVRLDNPRSAFSAITDDAGRYTLRQLPAGWSRLRIQHIGHEVLELDVIVPGGREVVVDAVLKVRPVNLPRVTAEAGGAGRRGTDSIPASDGDLALAGARAIENTPGLAELGLTDAVRGIPGEEPDPASLLYVRGAAQDLKLVYLDGAPVYAPFPLGGLLEPFAPGLLDRASIYLGGAPARYDGGLSYVMDLRTRSGRKGGVRTSGAADLLSARVMAEAAAGDRATAVLSLRGMHPYGSAALFSDGLPYEYGEALARGDVRIGDTGLLSITGFTNREAVKIGSGYFAADQIEWGNESGSVRLRGAIGETSAEATVAAGSYAARLPLTGSRPALAEGSANRTRLSLDLSRRFDSVQLQYGASFDDQSYQAEAIALGTGASSGIVEGSGSVAGAYAELSAQPHERVRLRGGARIDHFSTGTGLAIAPRIAATLMVTDRAAFTVAAGRYHQFLRPPDELLLRESAGTAGGSTDPASALVVGTASHFTAGLDQDLGEGLRLGLDAFYKHFADVPTQMTSEANASGMDLWIRRTAGGIDGWLGYSLAWVWSSTTSPGQADFTGRHLLSSGVTTPIGERTAVELRFAYGAGLPYSAIPLEVSLQQGQTSTNYAARREGLTSADRGGTETAPLLHTPDEPFIRLDAQISQRWTPTHGGRTMEIIPYVRVLNSLGRRDALFYFLDPSRGDDFEAIGALPIIPVVGVEWNF